MLYGIRVVSNGGACPGEAWKPTGMLSRLTLIQLLQPNPFTFDTVYYLYILIFSPYTVLRSANNSRKPCFSPPSHTELSRKGNLHLLSRYTGLLSPLPLSPPPTKSCIHLSILFYRSFGPLLYVVCMRVVVKRLGGTTPIRSTRTIGMLSISTRRMADALPKTAVSECARFWCTLMTLCRGAVRAFRGFHWGYSLKKVTLFFLCHVVGEG